jgi:integrase/recombinase XerD
VAYQYVREPLRAQEADALSHACETTEEKLIIWTLIDTGLRVSELCSLTSQHVLWQQKALRIQGKGGPYGKRSKHRVVPMPRRIQPLMEHYFAIHARWFVGPRQVQKIVKRVANRAKITQAVTPHVLMRFMDQRTVFFHGETVGFCLNAPAGPGREVGQAGSSTRSKSSMTTSSISSVSMRFR